MRLKENSPSKSASENAECFKHRTKKRDLRELNLFRSLTIDTPRSKHSLQPGNLIDSYEQKENRFGPAKRREEKEKSIRERDKQICK